jgi:dolichol-phosphate mannosyltransferase|tara:strand:+ start:157 stop:855 length:699 start_codon:yes stop_codon:yes gene_type:complete
MTILVLMPTYNEVGVLESSIEQVLAQRLDLEILVIDDNSPDGTGVLAEDLSLKHSRVSVLHRNQKQGLGKAYIAGFEWAIEQGFDFVVQMDADGSHRPNDLEKLTREAHSNRLVIGSRWTPGGKVENWPWFRRVISRAGNFYARKMLSSTVKDMTAGFRCYPTALLQAFPLEKVQAHGYGFQVEMTLLCQDRGVEIVEVPIIFVERVKGKSKMTYGIVLEAFWLCTKWRFRR